MVVFGGNVIERSSPSLGGCETLVEEIVGVLVVATVEIEVVVLKVT